MLLLYEELDGFVLLVFELLVFEPFIEPLL